MNGYKVMRIIIFTVFFVSSFSLVFGAGYYRKTLYRESAIFKVNLPVSETNHILEPVVFNIQNEGLPKKLIQPGKIAIGTGHGGGLTNHGEEPLWVEVGTAGFNGEVTLASTNLWFDEKTGRFLKPIRRGDSFVIEVELSLPGELLQKPNPVSTGRIIFTNSRNRETLAVVPVKIINSKDNQPHSWPKSGRRPG